MRIEAKKKAIMKYEDFLEEVRKANPDEFAEIPEIINRYDILIQENQKLDKTHQELEQTYKQMKENTNKYIKDKETEIMKLNNDTTNQKAEWEDIMDQQNILKDEAAEISSKKNNKISELAQILMAIENIEQKCFKREGTKSAVKHNIPNIDQKPQNFDNLEASVNFAINQLNVIKYYMADYIEIIKAVEQDPSIKQYLNNLKDRSELI